MRSFRETRQILCAHARRVVDEQTRRVDAGMHIGEHVGDRLVLGERNAELLTFLGVGEGRVKGCAGDPQRLGGDADSPAFEVGERDRESLAALSQQVIFRDRTILQRDGASVRGADAELVLRAIDDEAWRVGGHDEGRQPLLAQLGIGNGEHDGDLRTLAVGHEKFAAVKHPFPVL